MRERLEIADREVFAEQLGISKGALAHYERGERVPDASVLSAYHDRFGIDLTWLVTGDDAPTAGAPARAGDLIHLPQYDVSASAGRGEIAYKEHAVDEVGFDRRFLRNLGAQPEACFLMWAKGDSMLPTFPDGAMLIVDQSQLSVDDGRIYVFNAHGNLLVKRARWRMDGHLELASDNVAGGYPVEIFGADRIEDLIVVGRVVWYGRPI